jgi:ssDNA-binding Zn-finger/Zn-ribbon topoisomerase 1
MEKNTIGNIIKKLEAGETVQCPECKKGNIISKRENDTHFECNFCDFVINID